jgi:hypothetical protein
MFRYLRPTRLRTREGIEGLSQMTNIQDSSTLSKDGLWLRRRRFDGARIGVNFLQRLAKTPKRSFWRLDGSGDSFMRRWERLA